MKFLTAILSASCALLMAPLSAQGAGGIRVGNLSRSYADGYNQANAMRQQAQSQQAASAVVAPTVDDLPVRVANAGIAEMIVRDAPDAPVTMDKLTSCSMIYPDGEFAWDKPTLGMRVGGASQCVAVVELRGYQMGPNGADVVLARANLSAGDAAICNISNFPESTYMPDAANVTFPADRAPTMDDVIATMNQEQKQNAGLKIAAGTLVSALAGNMAGKNQPGETKLMGGGQDKMQSTAIGALSGAAIMAGNVYGGKVAGDTILSAAVNAAAGSAIGNMGASGESVLRIEDCELPEGIPTKCIWGHVVPGVDVDMTNSVAYFSKSDGETTYLCDKNSANCRTETLINIRIDGFPDVELEEMQEQQFQNIGAVFHVEKDSVTGAVSVLSGGASDGGGDFVKIASAQRPSTRTRAMIAVPQDKAFGIKRSDWKKWKRSNISPDATVYGRDSTNKPFVLKEPADVANFYPLTVDADDGGLIDFGNKARLKGTLVGAGAGGALGAFAGYQGAQQDIQDRWTTAVREYNDSLQKFYCATGTRFLGAYNSNVSIPTMRD